jgi:hypothetical protein
MKLVAISVVRNESDIVEAFVRHTCAWVDHHLVLDRDSTDGTRQILAALVQEGLPLSLFAGGSAADLAQIEIDPFAQHAFASYEADWVLPLNADEFFIAVDRDALEHQLASGPSDRPVSVPSRDYSPTTADDSATHNPVLRIQHRQHGATGTARTFIPRASGLSSGVRSGKCADGLDDDTARLDTRALTGTWLGRFSLRSPQQQVLRVVTGEMERLSRGRSHAGLNTHNRLGFQLLAENPEAFFSTATQPPGSLVLDPVPYLGGPLRYEQHQAETVLSERTLLPFLEKLARSHGQLVDQMDAPSSSVRTIEPIRPLDPAEVPELPNPDRAPFSGFVPLSGWQKQEGPVPSAFLPAFHWATAPETALSIHAKADGLSRLQAEILTYAERQVTTVVLNGKELFRHVFTQVNQKEALTALLKLRAGENRLVFRHRSWLHSSADPRKLALIFLSLRIDEI